MHSDLKNCFIPGSSTQTTEAAQMNRALLNLENQNFLLEIFPTNWKVFVKNLILILSVSQLKNNRYK